MDPLRIDLHQHLWPEPFVGALRTRKQPPRLDGWTLLRPGERPRRIDPVHHDVEVRLAEAGADGYDLVLVSACSGLGIDRLPPEDAEDLSRAWIKAAVELPAPFRPWAIAGLRRRDVAALDAALDAGAVGLEVAADVIAAPGGIEHLAPLLELLQVRDRPLFVHPGPARREGADERPQWWAPLVVHTAQLQAAWWAWAHAGRVAFPHLRVCFAALAGLAPLQGERHRVCGGNDAGVDVRTFVETSSYGTQAIDATIRALGIDVICHGSDRPCAAPADLRLGAAAEHAFAVRNPGRLLAPVTKEVLV